MNKRNQILNKIETIFKKEFNDENLKITEESSANNVELWDSINNLIIISAIEQEFEVSFPIEVIFNAENVGDLINYIVNKNEDVA